MKKPPKRGRAMHLSLSPRYQEKAAKIAKAMGITRSELIRRLLDGAHVPPSR